MKILIILFCCLSSLHSNELVFPKKLLEDNKICQKISKDTGDRLFLYTYPRSGSHWTRYLLKYFTNRLLTAPGKKGHLKHLDTFSFGSDLSKPYIHAWHHYNKDKFSLFNIPSPRLDRDKILLIVRNPLECVIRQKKYHDNLSIDQIISFFKEEPFKLYDSLEFYESWPTENRLLIYYEDLISNPEKELSKLLTFLDEPLDLLPNFLENIEWHIEQSIRLYDTRQSGSGGSHSQGKDLLYHSRNLNPYDRQELINVLKNQNLSLFQKHLARYEDLYD